MPRGWAVGSLRQLMRGYWGGSWAGQDKADSDAGMVRIAGTERKTEEEEWVSGGLSAHWVSGSCDCSARAPVPWFSQGLGRRAAPLMRPPRYFRGFRSLDLNGS